MCSLQKYGDTKIAPKEQPDSSSNDEGSWSGSPMAGKGVVLKKGPWTTTEDAMLIDFVKKNGVGNWNAVRRYTGLLRCGKSCRLRWANHLRPELKKGQLTREEEQIIIQMHAKIGNKWARMAALLPGRTDNEIKNFWNTRTKRMQRAGLPLHSPTDDGLGASDDSLLIQNASELYHDDIESSVVLQGSIYEMPGFEFDPLRTSFGSMSYAPLAGPHSTYMLSQGLWPRARCILHQGMNRARRNIESIASEELPNELSESMYQNLGLVYSYDVDPDDKSLISFGCSIPGSHDPSHCNFSASSYSSGTVKLELPSLQCPEANYSTWIAPPYHIDVPSPPGNVPFLPDCASPRSNGLLEALVHESKTISCGKMQSSEKSSCSSAISLSDMMESTAVNFYATEVEETSDQMSPFSQSVGELAPIASDSFDEFPSEAFLGSEATMAIEEASASSVPDKKPPHWPDFPRTDALLESNWILRDYYGARETSATSDEDLCPAVISLDSCPWNSMPSVCQMAEYL